MIEQADTLVTIAEVAVGLAGFSGIIVAIGREHWSESDVLSIWALLQASFGCVVLSFVPSLLAELIADEVLLWKVAVFCVLVFNLTILVVDWYRMLTGPGVLPPIVLLVPGLLFPALLTILQVSVLLVYLDHLAYFTFLASLIWLLCVAVLWFFVL